MSHRGCRRRAMPMLDAGRTPDHIAGSDFLDQPAPALRPPNAGGDDQSLAKGVRMPIGVGAGLERDARAGDTRWIGRLEQRINSYRSSEVSRRSLGGWLRSA